MTSAWAKCCPRTDLKNHPTVFDAAPGYSVSQLLCLQRQLSFDATLRLILIKRNGAPITWLASLKKCAIFGSQITTLLLSLKTLYFSFG